MDVDQFTGAQGREDMSARRAFLHELGREMKTNWNQLDKNADGSLSQVELQDSGSAVGSGYLSKPVTGQFLSRNFEQFSIMNTQDEDGIGRPRWAPTNKIGVSKSDLDELLMLSNPKLNLGHMQREEMIKSTVIGFALGAALGFTVAHRFVPQLMTRFVLWGALGGTVMGFLAAPSRNDLATRVDGLARRFQFEPNPMLFP